MDEEIGFKDRKAKKTFLRYALPCSDEKDRGKIIKCINKGLDIDMDLSESFPMALNVLKISSNEKGKKWIDEETVRRYFWFKHAEVLKENNPEKKIDKCLVLPGKVQEKIEGDEEISVSLINGEKRTVKTHLIKNVGENSLITVHWNYGCEKITEGDKKEIKDFLLRLKVIE
ncbi:MAG: hypothetical protein ACOCTT_03630 [archaeon]